MNEKTNKSSINKEARMLRRQNKRIEESRSLIKAKNHEKGKIIKAHEDRQTELAQNRDEWKAKCKEQERQCAEAEKNYKHVAGLLNIKEEQLKEILREFEKLKKKISRRNDKVGLAVQSASMLVSTLCYPTVRSFICNRCISITNHR